MPPDSDWFHPQYTEVPMSHRQRERPYLGCVTNPIVYSLAVLIFVWSEGTRSRITVSGAPPPPSLPFKPYPVPSGLVWKGPDPVPPGQHFHHGCSWPFCDYSTFCKNGRADYIYNIYLCKLKLFTNSFSQSLLHPKIQGKRECRLAFGDLISVSHPKQRFRFLCFLWPCQYFPQPSSFTTPVLHPLLPKMFPWSPEARRSRLSHRLAAL